MTWWIVKTLTFSFWYILDSFNVENVLQTTPEPVTGSSWRNSGMEEQTHKIMIAQVKLQMRTLLVLKVN